MTTVEVEQLMPGTSEEVALTFSLAKTFLREIPDGKTGKLKLLGLSLLANKNPFAIPFLTASGSLQEGKIDEVIKSIGSKPWTELYETGLRIQNEGGKVVFPGTRAGEHTIEVLLEPGQAPIVGFPTQKGQVEFFDSKFKAAEHMLRPGAGATKSAT